jgi:DNA-binding CsgD family transcriptional regulator
MDSLTRREREILLLVAEGHRNDDIAEKLCLSEKTVRNHITHILAKLGLRTRAELIAYAWRNALIKPGQEEKG